MRSKKARVICSLIFRMAKRGELMTSSTEGLALTTMNSKLRTRIMLSKTIPISYLITSCFHANRTHLQRKVKNFLLIMERIKVTPSMLTMMIVTFPHLVPQQSVQNSTQLIKRENKVKASFRLNLKVTSEWLQSQYPSSIAKNASL